MVSNCETYGCIMGSDSDLNYCTVNPMNLMIMTMIVGKVSSIV